MSNVVALDDHRPMDPLCEVRLMRAQDGSLQVAITDAFDLLFQETPDLSPSERVEWIRRALEAAAPSFSELAAELQKTID
jgi:hypothetical protein